MEIYLGLFLDSLINSLALTFSKPYWQELMLYFGYNKFAVGIFSVAGSVSGLLINFFVFYFIANICKKSLSENEGYISSSQLLQKIYKFILPITFFDFYGKFITVFLGLSKINISNFILLVIIYRIINFLYIIYVG